ncbi:Glutamyl-tRNA reductase [uncultured delta proteobacterium]|uniref:Glutamyl-tRNA reductase n=1 Tax=uncultured delta proteobacterium TaxID=34034 RepID=A0A212J2K8_9DELT|nr:Glutamyl-tRNA reductase [uncultured delta proteobacterium]
MKRTVYLFGLNHRSADVAVRESFALSDAECRVCDVIPLDAAITEALILSTCNRVEILAVGEGEGVRQKVLECWAGQCGRSCDELAPHVYMHEGTDAVLHLFRVASGLDSLVLGEPQILGQLKDAYRKALEQKASKVILNRLLHKAFMTAKRVRTETGVASSAVSVSYAAVSLARRIFGDLQGKTVLVVGAGEMAELAATHLAEGQGAHLAFTNRTYERAMVLATRFKGSSFPFDELPVRLEEADIVISSTGAPEPVITLEMMRPVMKKRRDKPLFCIDIAVPRDVEDAVSTLDEVYLYNIDDLSEVVASNRAARQGEARKAEGIVADEAERFCAWMHSLGLQGTIADIVHRSESIMEEELEKTLRRIGPVTPETAEALRLMIAAMAKKLNHDPITYLKRRYTEEDTGMRLVTLARSLFNLDGENVPDDAHLGRKRRP